MLHFLVLSICWQIKIQQEPVIVLMYGGMHVPSKCAPYEHPSSIQLVDDSLHLIEWSIDRDLYDKICTYGSYLDDHENDS